MSDLHKSDPDSPYADDMEFVRDYAERNDGYALVQPVVDFINAHPDPTIIRTVKELWSMDLDTLLYCGWKECHFILAKDLHPDHLPAVVITPADQVRAAQKALEEA